MDVIEAIEARTSVRTYTGDPLTPEQVESINAAIAAATCPLPGECAIELQRFAVEGPLCPGTYGVIKGASDYLLLGFADNQADAVCAGFTMEQVVLACTQQGLGTCWMAGTFRGSDFEVVAHFPVGMELQVVSPVGTPAGKLRFIEKLTRFTVGSKNRKPLGELFSIGGWGKPVTDSSQYYEPLSMMRLAPSSTNSQPWRALIKGDSVHFYCRAASKVHMVDMGIGLCHFDITERYRGHEGCWSVDPVSAPKPEPGLTYVASYTRR